MTLIEIDLQNEPECLRVLRKDESTTYADLKDQCLKNVRALLSQSQNGFCAYCEQKFKSKIFIEHYIAQSTNSSKGLDLDNFLGICSGIEYFDGKKNAKHIAHCGTKRGSSQLTIDPRNAAHVSLIYYDNEASIRSTNSQHDQELEQTLNLNFDALKEKRNEAYKKNYKRIIQVSKVMNLPKEEVINKAISALKANKSEFRGYLKYKYIEQSISDNNG